MAPTTEQIREQYLANQIFLIGEKLSTGLEVIDRRANYIVVVDGKGETKKMFLDEAYGLKFPDPEVDDPDEVIQAREALNNSSPEEREAAEQALKKAVYNWKHPKLEHKPVRFSKFSTALVEGFTYKGYKPHHFQNYPVAQAIFENLTKTATDPYAMLSAIKQLDIFFEKLDAVSLERARTAIAKVDSIENHSYLVEGLITVEPTLDTPLDGFVKEDTLADEEIDFAIEEKLTYLNFRVVLTESFEHHVDTVLTHLEKNPKELDELADHVKTIAHIAHHYDTHSVHMKESTEDKTCATCKGTGEVETGIGMMPCDDCHPVDCKNCNSTGVVDTGIGELPCDHCHGARAVNESTEDKAIEHAEQPQRIHVRKLSSGPQMIKIAKRAAVELIAQKLANKPIKKISSKEKDVIVKAIKNKKAVVMKLARKLIPRIKRIEHENFEHEEFGSAE